MIVLQQWQLTKRWAALLLGALVLVMLGCARTSDIARPSSEDGKTITVTGSCEAKLEQGNAVLAVTGTCNLMDGTNGIFSVLGADGTKVEEHQFTKEGAEMSWLFDVKADWPDVVYGFISFDTQNTQRQPDTVTDAYGKRFQNLTGDYVIWDTKGVIAVFQSKPVEISRQPT